MVHAARPNPPAKPRRILVVDDDPDVASCLADVLAAIGHECQQAVDGRAALDAVDRFHPDVVLLDLNLPKMSGFEVVDRLRGRPDGRELVIVAITGHGSQQDVLEARDAGFDHYLVKPIALESLRTLVGHSKAPAPSEGADSMPPRASLVAQVALADAACARDDGRALAAAVLPVIAMAPETLAIDLVAVIELARYDVDLAKLRWSYLRTRLR